MGDKIDLSAAAANVAQSFPNWVYDINQGAGESGQTVTFSTFYTSGTAGLFSVEPAIATDGTLTFTWNGNLGNATYVILGTDDGGTDFGGNDTSYAYYFNIEATASGISILPLLIDTGDFVVADRGPYLGTGKILLIRGPDSLKAEPGTQRVLSTQLNDPYGVAMDSLTGDIYVADYETLSPGSAGGIYKLDQITLELTLVSDPTNDFVTPFDLAVDPDDGSIYVVDLDAFITGAIFRVDPSDGSVTTVSTGEAYFWLRGIALDPNDGYIYVSDSGDPFSLDPVKQVAKIFEIDLSTGPDFTTNIISSATNLVNPDGLSVDPRTGQLFVVEAENKMILEIDLSAPNFGNQIIVSDNSMFSNDYIRPTHLSFSFCDCFLYVTDGKIGAVAGERRLYKVDRDTGEASIFTKDGFFDQPRGLTEVFP